MGALQQSQGGGLVQIQLTETGSSFWKHVQPMLLSWRGDPTPQALSPQSEIYTCTGSCKDISWGCFSFAEGLGGPSGLCSGRLVQRSRLGAPGGMCRDWALWEEQACVVQQRCVWEIKARTLGKGEGEEEDQSEMDWLCEGSHGLECARAESRVVLELAWSPLHQKL